MSRGEDQLVRRSDIARCEQRGAPLPVHGVKSVALVLGRGQLAHRALIHAHELRVEPGESGERALHIVPDAEATQTA